MPDYLTDLADAARSSGLPVVELAGWKTRGRKTDSTKGAFKPRGVMCHHTGDKGEGKWVAEGVLTKGRTGLPGPLCQLSLSREGVVYVVAAGRANHAGKVRSVGFLKAGDGNTQSIGIEAQNSGTEGWTAKQIEAYYRLCAALCDWYKYGRGSVVGHGEASTAGKWDPGKSQGKMIDMNVFRSKVKAVQLGGPIATPSTDKMDPAAYFIGAVGPHVTWLGQRLVLHLENLGLEPAYTAGPGPTYTDVDRAVVTQFQLAQGWRGADADGFPGPETLKRLAAVPAPVVVPPPVVLPKLLPVAEGCLNAAGFNDKGADNYPGRVREYAPFIKGKRLDLMMFQELSDSNPVSSAPLEAGSKIKRQSQRDMTDAALKGSLTRIPKGSDGRHIYGSSRVKVVASGHFEAAKANLFNGDDKQAAWAVVDVTDGKLVARAIRVSFHTENENGIDKKTGKSADNLRVAQMIDWYWQTMKVAAQYKVPIENVLFAGDTNSDNMVRRAMETKGFLPVGASGYGTLNRWKGSVKGDDPIDYAFRHVNAKAGSFSQKRDATMSDHDALYWTTYLVAA